MHDHQKHPEPHTHIMQNPLHLNPVSLMIWTHTTHQKSAYWTKPKTAHDLQAFMYTLWTSHLYEVQANFQHTGMKLKTETPIIQLTISKIHLFQDWFLLILNIQPPQRQQKQVLQVIFYYCNHFSTSNKQDICHVTKTNLQKFQSSCHLCLVRTRIINLTDYSSKTYFPMCQQRGI